MYSTLENHVKRVNYKVGIWKISHMANPEVPNPEEHGWKMVDGMLQPQWFQDRAIPEKLEELEKRDLCKDDESDSENEYLFDSETQSDSGEE